MGSPRGLRRRVAASLAAISSSLARIAAPLNRGAPTPALGRPSVAPSTSSPDVSRPCLLGVSLERRARLAVGASRGETGNGHQLAPSRFSLVLDLEERTPHL